MSTLVYFFITVYDSLWYLAQPLPAVINKQINFIIEFGSVSHQGHYSFILKKKKGTIPWLFISIIIVDAQFEPDISFTG